RLNTTGVGNGSRPPPARLVIRMPAGPMGPPLPIVSMPLSRMTGPGDELLFRIVTAPGTPLPGRGEPGAPGVLPRPRGGVGWEGGRAGDAAAALERVGMEVGVGEGDEAVAGRSDVRVDIHGGRNVRNDAVAERDEIAGGEVGQRRLLRRAAIEARGGEVPVAA